MLRSVLLLLIALNVRSGFAQNRISGTVQDALTGEPLAFAHVHLMQSSIGTVTNSNGKFSLLVPENHLNSSLGISFMGYENAFLQISSLQEVLTIELQPKSIDLPDLIISNKQKSLIEEAIAAIPKNHDQEQMKLRGFWRATMQGKNDFLQISESAFDIYRSEGENYLQLLKGRIARDSAALKRLSNFSAGVRPAKLFDDSFLKGHTLLHPKTVKNHTYELVDVQAMGDRNAFVLRFDRKEKSNKNGYTGTIWLDTETLAFIKIKATLSPKNGQQYLFEDSRLIGALVGLNKSTLDQYAVDMNYQLINGKWYLNYAKYDVRWTMINGRTEVNEPIRYLGDFVVTELSKSFEMPNEIDFEKNKILEQQRNFNEANFWKDYTYLIPDEDLERLFQEIERRNESN